MLRRFFAVIAFLSLLSGIVSAQSAQLLAESGDWKAFKYNDPTTGGLVCFIISAPTQMEGNYQRRGPVWLHVAHRQNESNAANRVNVVSFAAGFQFWDDFNL